jgi:hypothetical protein
MPETEDHVHHLKFSGTHAKQNTPPPSNMGSANRPSILGVPYAQYARVPLHSTPHTTPHWMNIHGERKQAYLLCRSPSMPTTARRRSPWGARYQPGQRPTVPPAYFRSPRGLALARLLCRPPTTVRAGAGRQGGAPRRSLPPAFHAARLLPLAERRGAAGGGGAPFRLRSR